MYLLQIYTHNACKNGDRLVLIEKAARRIRKWTLLPAGTESEELLRLIALVSCGATYAPYLPHELSLMFRDRRSALRVGSVVARHTPYDCWTQSSPIAGNVFCVDYKDEVTSIRNNLTHPLLPVNIARFRSTLGSGNTALFSLAFGPKLSAHDGNDDFEFTNPNFRVTRYSSLFDPDASVTDPAEFLRRLHYRAIRCGRFPAKQTLRSLSELFA